MRSYTERLHVPAAYWWLDMLTAVTFASFVWAGFSVIVGIASYVVFCGGVAAALLLYLPAPAGTVDDTDKIAAELEKMKYQGAVSQVPLFFNDKHQVTFATEVCLVEPNTSDKFKCAVEQPPENPPPGDPGG